MLLPVCFIFHSLFSSLIYWRVTLTQTVFYAFTLANAAYDKHKNKKFSVSLRTVGSCHISFSVLASQRFIAWCFLFHPMCLCSQKERKRIHTNWVFTWMKLHTHVKVQTIMRKYFLYKKIMLFKLCGLMTMMRCLSGKRSVKNRVMITYKYFFLGFLAKMFSIIKTTITTWQRLQ